ncbi:unnamed protein product, partial [Ectocarpus fasciculatus]
HSNHNRSCEDGGAMFPLDDDDDDNAEEDAYMADEFDPAGPPDVDTDDDDDSDDEEEESDSDSDSDTEDITDEGSMTLSSGSGGGDGGGVPSPYHASDISQRFAAAVDRRKGVATPPLSSSAPAGMAQVAAAAAPMGMSVDSGRWAGATVTTAAAASPATAFSAA